MNWSIYGTDAGGLARYQESCKCDFPWEVSTIFQAFAKAIFAGGIATAMHFVGRKCGTPIVRLFKSQLFSFFSPSACQNILGGETRTPTPCVFDVLARLPKCQNDQFL